MITSEDLERLQEIRDEMMCLLEEAESIVKDSTRSEYERAKAYWIGHIDSALGCGNYVGDPNSMSSTIKNLETLQEKNEVEDEEDEDVF